MYLTCSCLLADHDQHGGHKQFCWVEACGRYLRGERDTDRMGDLDPLRAGDPLPLRAGLTDLEADLEADLQTKTHNVPVRL